MHLPQLIDTPNPRFRSASTVRQEMINACRQNSDLAHYVSLGYSETGHPIDAVVLGNGMRTVSLLAGAHADEPVGPETLRTFVLKGLQQRVKLAELYRRYRFVVIPHINPDGEEQNQTWIRNWPDATAYLRHVIREPPGLDLEFGYPQMRVENRLVAGLLGLYAPFDLHISLHGMGFSEGVMLLIERHWIDKTIELRRRFVEFAENHQLRLHDHDRKGEKGFIYIGPGFSTTPEGEAMQVFFRSRGDEETAAKFHLSSMEYVRKLGGNPLCLVTELPLFLIENAIAQHRPGIPAAYLAFKSRIPELQLKLTRGETIAEPLESFEIRPLDLALAMKFQLFILESALTTIATA